MDSLFGFLVIIGIIVNIVKSVSKQQQSGNRAGPRPAGRTNPEMPWQRMLGDMMKSIESPVPAVKSVQSQSVGKTGQASTSQVQGGEGYGSMETASEYIDGRAVLSPSRGSTLSETYVEMQPTTSTGGIFFPPSGSMRDASSEGKSLNEESASPGSVARQAEKDAAQKAAAAPAKAALPGITLSFNKDAIVQAVVMSEVLTRPCDRKRRWSAH